ncbi:hypothetical protein RJ639_005529 [Escallonia herrerae]|uniref:t-SNARE coiled-coil homology domain-containing protein n=1 Tax=Escallonia herrerae TaxID=1293975 RepID=A0AA88VXE5_9ASTE|nr:hypothetical protein RJ639_005529 [Escallonia herrerae]
MVSSSGASSCRDRTLEFRSLSETLKKIGGATAASNGPQSDQAATSYRSEFNKRASCIGLSIHETSLKIARLANLAKRSSIFDDPLKEIQELSALINSDISTLNLAVSDLQTLKNLETADGIHSEDRVVHSTAVFDDLNRKLMGTAKEFHDVLNTRTENIKAHEQRKQIFSTNMSRQNPLRQHVKTVTEPPPWSSSSNSSESLQPSESSGSGVQSSQLRRRLAPDNSPSHHMEVSMLQQVVPRQESYSQSRAFALQNVESTISELGGIFTHLATMVAQQGELAIRIDDNMEESLANVEGARSALLRHLNQISSNRSLLIKIFAILIFFLIVFIFFLA